MTTRPPTSPRNRPLPQLREDAFVRGIVRTGGARERLSQTADGSTLDFALLVADTAIVEEMMRVRRALLDAHEFIEGLEIPESAGVLLELRRALRRGGP